MTITTPYNHKINHSPSGGLSLTIPDDTMSISEILRRFSCGLPIGGQKVPFYESDDDQEIDTMPNLKGLDLCEIAELKQQATADLKRIQSDLQKQSRKHSKDTLKNFAGDARRGENPPSQTHEIELLKVQLKLEQLQNQKTKNTNNT